MFQAEEAAAEITRKLEKQEKKRLKKEKKQLAATALASSENSSSTPEECEEMNEKTQKEEEAKAPEGSSGEWKTHLSPSPNPRKRNLFPRRISLVVIVKRQLAVEVLPRGRIFAQRGTS